MKKIVIYTIAIFLTLICFTLSLAGCGNTQPTPNEPPVAVAILLGNHANSYTLNISNPALVSDVAQATTNGFVSIVNCDDQPAIISADIYSVPEQYRQANPAKLKADARQRAANLLNSLTSVKAKNPELDTLLALAQAVRSLSSAPAGSSKILWVLDTGLSSTGELDFRNNLIGADPKAIVDQLARRSAIPDFTGITVKWQQLGDVAQPQSVLSPLQLSNLKAIYTGIIEKGGGKLDISDIPPAQTVNDPGQYPPISVIKLPQEPPIKFDPAKVTVFNSSQVQFIGDTARYVNKTAAKTALQPTADYMKVHPEFKGLLVGTTATGDQNYCLKLSQARADAVRGTLISMGVPGGQLITKGLGCNDPWHIKDTDVNGHLIEPQASQNRKVVLLDANSEAAKAILRA